jgi:peptidyl-prolyl cis-trans isomerase SurA
MSSAHRVLSLAVVALLVLALAPALPAKIVDRIVAQVNDDIITLSDVNRELQALRQELARDYSGDQLEAEVKKREKDVLESLVRDKLLLQKANELGFNANVDVQVSAAIERIRQENKIKDLQEFERLLNQQGMSMPGFREQIKKQIIKDSLIDSFVRSRITLTTTEIEKYYKDHPGSSFPSKGIRPRLNRAPGRFEGASRQGKHSRPWQASTRRDPRHQKGGVSAAT